jgi:hypothetical protein
MRRTDRIAEARFGKSRIMALALAADKVWKATRVQEIFVKSSPDPLLAKSE